ncbi:hypothetical protein D3C79_931400 [compost metagenome]
MTSLSERTVFVLYRLVSWIESLVVVLAVSLPLFFLSNLLDVNFHKLFFDAN